MADYIELEALLSFVKPDDPSDEKDAITIATAKKLIRSLAYRVPSADVAPVRHGHWILRKKWEPFEFKYECSICHDGSDLESKYCHNCGAKMYGGSDG